MAYFILSVSLMFECYNCYVTKQSESSLINLQSPKLFLTAGENVIGSSLKTEGVAEIIGYSVISNTLQALKTKNITEIPQTLKYGGLFPPYTKSSDGMSPLTSKKEFLVIPTKVLTFANSAMLSESIGTNINVSTKERHNNELYVDIGLSKKASLFVLLWFIPALLLFSIFCRYVPEKCIEIME